VNVSEPLRVYEGAVFHERLKPVSHQLRYAVFSFLIDVDRLDEIAKTHRYFSRNKFNLFSFYDRDHGDGETDDIGHYVREQLRDFNLAAPAKIFLLCYPRMLGYVFNPLSVYYCYDHSGALTAILYEVRNTFGGRHSYLAPVEQSTHKIEHETNKRFHVSPFNEMNLQYHFKMRPPGQAIRLFIETCDGSGPVLNACFTGRAASLTDRKLLSLFWRYPLMTLKVIMGIHFEAIRLLAKGMRLKKGAPDPIEPVTLVESPITLGTRAA